MNDMDLTVHDVEKINDQDRLLEIIRNQDLDFAVRHRAVRNLEDKSFFKDCAHAEDDFLRIFAAEFIDDDETLLDMILNDSNDYVRRKAGSNFIDNCDSEKYSDVLLEFALENPKYNVNPIGDTDVAARFACHRIEDTSKLLRVIKESPSKYVYRYAMRNVDDESLFELLQSGELDSEKTHFLADKLDDENVLRDLLYAKKVNVHNRIRIAVKLRDDEMLKELLDAPLGPYIPEGKAFPDIYPGDRLYVHIVFNYPNEEIAIQALKLIGYEKNLKYVMENHKNPKIRDLAAEMYENCKRH